MLKSNNATGNNLPSAGAPKEDPLKYEYATLVEEYRIANGRITRKLDADERGLELTFLAVAAAVAATKIVAEQTAYALLLVLAVPFHALIWAHIRRSLAHSYLVKYITEVLTPRLNTIIQHTSVDHEQYGKAFHFESWEGYVRSQLKDKPILESILPLSSAGKILIELGAAIVLLVSYVLLRAYDPQYVTTVLDTSLLILDVLLSFISLFYLIVVFKHSFYRLVDRF